MSILSIYYVNINDVLTYDNAPYVVFCRFCLEENIWGGGGGVFRTLTEGECTMAKRVFLLFRLKFSE